MDPGEDVLDYTPVTKKTQGTPCSNSTIPENNLCVSGCVNKHMCTHNKLIKKGNNVFKLSQGFGVKTDKF